MCVDEQEMPLHACMHTISFIHIMSSSLIDHKDEEVAGDKRLKEIRQILAKYNHITTQNVKEEYEKIILTQLPHIYGEDWERVQQRVLHEHKIDSTEESLSLNHLTEDAVSILVAALVRTIPEYHIAIITSGMRQSRFLVNKIRLCLREVNDRIIRYNPEEIWLAAPDADLTKKKNANLLSGASRAFVFPSYFKSLRGQTATSILLMCDIPKESMQDVVYPLMTVKHTTLLQNNKKE